MKQYDYIETTPLKWHKFFSYVLLPLSLFSNAVSLFQYLKDFYVHWAVFVDLFFIAVILICQVLSFVGFLSKKAYGWKAAIALYAFSVLYNLVLTILSFVLQTEERWMDLTTFVGACVGAGLSVYYYLKRKKVLTQYPSLGFVPQPGMNYYRDPQGQIVAVPVAPPTLVQLPEMPKSLDKPQETVVRGSFTPTPATPVVEQSVTPVETVPGESTQMEVLPPANEPVIGMPVPEQPKEETPQPEMPALQPEEKAEEAPAQETVAPAAEVPAPQATEPVKFPNYCSKCGHPTVPGSHFCGKCGARLIP